MSTKTATLADMLCVLHEGPDTSTAEEIMDACKLIIRVQAMTGAERDVIRAAFLRGPLDAGDIPSKSAEGILRQEGFVDRIVVKGEDGYCACTHKGAWAYRLIGAGACGFMPQEPKS